jgi:photosystem I subunit 2
MATFLAGSQMLAQTQRSSLAGTSLRQPAQRAALRPARQVVRADTTTDNKEKKDEKKASAPFSPPALDSSWPSPIFGGSTGGLMRKAQEEEFYCITWEAKKEVVFELPTGGAAIMRQGPNLLKLARKEQCLALLTQLRTKFKLNGQFYRVFPNGEVQYLHPKDGVYPEKVNAGRNAVNANKGRIGENLNPVQIKFSGKLGTYDK